MATIKGTPGDDNLHGTAVGDQIDAGSGDDEIYGNGGKDVIRGEGDADTIYGGPGADDVDGGDGTDRIYGDDIFPDRTDGADLLKGGAGDDFIEGGGGNDNIAGGANNDELQGGLGQDLIDGGDGNDIIGFEDASYATSGDRDVFIGGSGEDRFTITYGDNVDGGSGADTLFMYLFTAPAGITADLRKLTNGGTITVAGATLTGIEYVGGLNLTQFADKVIAGAVPGNDGILLSANGGDDEVTGTPGADLISGGDGNDILRGGGGYDPQVFPSGDRLFGEAGDDTIYIGDDGALASGGDGDDRLVGGKGGDDLLGDAGDDRLYGGGGRDALRGEGGNDWLVGGAGDDIIRGGAGIDAIDYSEEAGTGNVTVTLVDEAGGWPPKVGVGRDTHGNRDELSGIENVRTGDGADTVTGNSLENAFHTGAGQDVLDGGDGADTLNGGDDGDTMTGGLGDDFFFVDTGRDKVVEHAGGGLDTVQSSIDYALPGEVENLILTGNAERSGSGNAAANIIRGNAGPSTLTGRGGDDVLDGGAGNDLLYGQAGNDLLTGGAGLDRFFFITALGSTNVDRIVDFTVADDAMWLGRSVFGSAGPNGTLAAGAFVKATAAQDASDRIIYDARTGNIFYDADGKGGSAAVLFATVNPGTALTSADFVVYG